MGKNRKWFAADDFLRRSSLSDSVDRIIIVHSVVDPLNLTNPVAIGLKSSESGGTIQKEGKFTAL